MVLQNHYFLSKLGETGVGFEAKEMNLILNQCIATDSGGYDIYMLTFSDPPIQTPIETEIFNSRSEFQFFRTDSTSLEISGVSGKGITEIDLKILTGMDQVLFEQALLVGDKATLDRLNKKVKEIKTKMDEQSTAKQDDNIDSNDSTPSTKISSSKGNSFDSMVKSVVGQPDSNTELNQSNLADYNQPPSSLVPPKFKAINRKGRSSKTKPAPIADTAITQITTSETNDGGSNSP
jgi:hypothetical protein